MSDSRKKVITMHVWESQRKLLPTTAKGDYVQLHCLEGEGYVRNMARPLREKMNPGDNLVVAGGEVISITGSRDMIVEVLHEERLQA